MNSTKEDATNNKSWAIDFFHGQDGLEVHPFWYDFDIPGIDDAFHYGLGLYMAFVCIAGFLGNVLVIYLFSATKNLRTPSNMFIISLATSDALFSILMGFPLLTISSFYKKWIFGNIFCKIYGFGGGLNGFASINALTFISMDRYYVIAYPFEALKKVTMKRSLWQILLIWIWALVWSLPPLFGWGAYIPDGFQTYCSFDYLTTTASNKSYVYCITIFAFIIPAFIIIICYINIIRAVSKQSKSIEKTAEKLAAKYTKELNEQKQEIRLAKITAITFGLFLMSWIPYTIITTAGILEQTLIITPVSAQLPVMFAKMSAVYNPILYAISHPKFQAAINSRVPCLFKVKEKPSSKANVSVNVNSSRKKQLVSQASAEVTDVEVMEMNSVY